MDIGGIWQLVYNIGSDIFDKNTLFITLVLLVLIDIMSGLSAAAVTHTVSSAVGLPGMLIKSGYFLIIMTVRLLETTAVQISGINTGFTQIVVLGFIIYEATSILENATRMGIPLPFNIKDIFGNFSGSRYGTLALFVQSLKKTAITPLPPPNTTTTTTIRTEDNAKVPTLATTIEPNKPYLVTVVPDAARDMTTAPGETVSAEEAPIDTTVVKGEH